MERRRVSLYDLLAMFDSKHWQGTVAEGTRNMKLYNRTDDFKRFFTLWGLGALWVDPIVDPQCFFP